MARPTPLEDPVTTAILSVKDFAEAIRVSKRLGKEPMLTIVEDDSPSLTFYQMGLPVMSSGWRSFRRSEANRCFM